MKVTGWCAALAAVLASGLLTGCELLDTVAPDPVEPSASAETPVFDPWESALPVGSTYTGELTTTVLDVERPVGGPNQAPADATYEWLAAGVRTCASPGAPVAEVGWYQWAVATADGELYPAPAGYDSEWPARQYPVLGAVSPGECVEGTVLVAVPEEAEVLALLNADETGSPQGTWRLTTDEESAGTDVG